MFVAKRKHRPGEAPAPLRPGARRPCRNEPGEAHLTDRDDGTEPPTTRRDGLGGLKFAARSPQNMRDVEDEPMRLLA